ncbi:FitA-like ribbon-helix-helix domain-containing protein [Spirochaeta africana]|uniref:Antitoxin FitA-like ribbon-helix-helix domain-containing protein n=1 Tax=Spirochaeta africana (strain ATCC 700263 / DSM 8902 / Z-7692) TaxID=889378 RepID=H9UG57_SPIAZ|nr:hypothetical protein [Spirochaeta africana]AFG36500.1 hypothetical protein Spiaf_0395 [Spirochaeta africana DSM 8902]
MSQITIRNLSPELDHLIRQEALKRHISLNEAVQHLLRQATGLDDNSDRKRDLRKLAGGWTDENLHEFEQTQTINSAIDSELWQ